MAVPCPECLPSSWAVLHKSVLFYPINPQRNQKRPWPKLQAKPAGCGWWKATNEPGAVQVATSTSLIATVGSSDPHRDPRSPPVPYRRAARCQPLPNPTLPATRCLNMLPEPRELLSQKGGGESSVAAPAGSGGLKKKKEKIKKIRKEKRQKEVCKWLLDPPSKQGMEPVPGSCCAEQ